MHYGAFHNLMVALDGFLEGLLEDKQELQRENMASKDILGKVIKENNSIVKV